MLLFYFAGYVLLALGGLVCALNFYLSFLHDPLCRMRGLPEHSMSGLPLVGSLVAVPCLFWLPLPGWVLWPAIVLVALDTGGLHWFMGSHFWRHLFPPPERPNSR